MRNPIEERIPGGWSAAIGEREGVDVESALKLQFSEQRQGKEPAREVIVEGYVQKPMSATFSDELGWWAWRVTQFFQSDDRIPECAVLVRFQFMEINGEISRQSGRGQKAMGEADA